MFGSGGEIRRSIIDIFWSGHFSRSCVLSASNEHKRNYEKLIFYFSLVIGCNCIARQTRAGKTRVYGLGFRV